jgi:glucan phosphorylase
MLNFDNINLIAEQEYYPFSEEEIINITNHIKELEYKDSLNTEIINKYKQLISQYQTQEQLDTLLIYYKDKKIILMEERIEQLEKDS